MKDLIKKWWFWVVILVIVLIISFTIIMSIAFSTIKGDVSNIALKIQKIYPDATLYSSAGGNTLILELINYKNSENSDEQEKIIKLIKETKKNGKLKGFTKFVTISFIDSGEESNSLLMKTTVNLENFAIDNQESYILYKEYEELFKKYSDAMQGYTNLFNSIH